MRQVLRLAGREYNAAVRTKGFIIGLVLAPLLMGGGILGMVLLKGHTDTDDLRVALVDRSGLLSSAVLEAAQARNASELRDAEGRKVRPAYLIEPVAAPTEDPLVLRLHLSERVRRGELHAFVEIGPEVLHPERSAEGARIGYYAQNAALDEVRRWLATPINGRLRQLRLAEAGVSPAVVEAATAWVPVEGMGLASMDRETGKVADGERSSEAAAVGVPMAMMFFMFMMLMMGAAPLMNSVMEEKTQRIAEVILGSVRPFEFMMGKLVGGAAVSLTASAVYVLVAAVAATTQGFGGLFPYAVLPWFFAYMVLAVFMVGAMMAALGAACDTPRDTQTLGLPAMLPLMIPMFIMVPILEQPQGSLATWLSLVPIWTPLLMLPRLASPGGVPVWQPVLGLVGMGLFAVLSVWAGGRVFRVGLLMQGQPPRLGTILRWVLRG
ncbi:MAG: ABC transporter permease [Candidatus Latescibacterota bacterium]|jgi:ABC-type Na+ efflux pump permease subunit